MKRVITKELAVKIKDKLKGRAIKSRNKAHDEFVVEEDGIQIAIISIRRASEWDKGHDYLNKDLLFCPD